MAIRPAAAAGGQNAPVSSAYSATNTALPARTNGCSSSHSSYSKHCSFSAQSKSGSSAATCSRSFLRPIESPRACAARGEEAVVAELVVGGQREAAVVGVGVDVVGLDAVEALLLHRSSRRSMIGPSTSRRRTSSQCSPGQPSQLAADDGRGEVARVGPARLGRAGAEVADGTSAALRGATATTLAGLSKRSMSNSCASTERSTGVVSCHCHVVRGPGTQRPGAPGAGPGRGAGAGACAPVPGRRRSESTITARRHRRERCGLASRSETACEPASTPGRGRRGAHRFPRTRRDRTRPPSIRTTSRGAPAHRRARATMVRRDAAPSSMRARACPRPESASARPLLAVASRTVWPAAVRPACARPRAGPRPQPEPQPTARAPAPALREGSRAKSYERKGRTSRR